MSWVIRKGSGEYLRAAKYSNDARVFTIELHYGGVFRWGPETIYEGGKVKFIDNCKPIEMTYLQIIEMAERVGCNGVKKLYFLRPHSNPTTDLGEIRTDQDSVGLMGFVSSYRVVEVYCDCVGNTFEELNSSEDDDNDNYNGDEELGDFEEFTDSDGGLGLDEGFGNIKQTLQKGTKGKINDKCKKGNTKVDDQVDDQVDDKVETQPECNIEKDSDVLDNGYVSSDCLNSDCNSDEEMGRVKVEKSLFSKNDWSKVHFTVGLMFSTADEFTRAVKVYALQQARDVFFKRTTKLKKTVLCSDPDCQWRLYASKINGQATFQVKTLYDVHTCGSAVINRSAKPRLIADLYFGQIKINPWWKLRAFRDQVGHDLEIQISTMTAFRALSHAKIKLQSTSAEQYASLWDYLGEIKRANPGTTTEMKLIPKQGEKGQDDRFSRLYICWGAMKRGFLEGCRPIFGLDGCHLTGPHRGVLLAAVSIDPNNCMYPIAYAVVDQEKYSTWKWFLKLLRSDLNIISPESYTVMSDKQKGLIKAVEKVLPGVEHRFCVRHLYNNFKSQYKGLVLKDLLWKAARSTTVAQFEASLQEIKVINPDAYEWLASKPPEQWTKSHFQTHPKCDLLLNNMCECFNACIKEARGDSILTMLEGIRKYLMDLLMRKNEAMKKQTVLICPKIMVRLEKSKKFSHGWRPSFNGVNGFEVDSIKSGEKYSVDLERKECGCRRWHLSGLPCSHAIVAINYLRLKPEQFVHECYLKSTYLKTYANCMMPINGKELWVKTGKKNVIAPDVEIKVGKPKKARRRAPDEPKATSEKVQKLSRKGRIMTCTKCKKEGHNSRSCGREPKRGGRPNSGKKAAVIDDALGKTVSSTDDDDDHYGGRYIPVDLEGDQVGSVNIRVEAVNDEAWERAVSGEIETDNQRDEVDRDANDERDLQENVQREETVMQDDDESFWHSVTCDDELWDKVSKSQEEQPSQALESQEDLSKQVSGSKKGVKRKKQVAAHGRVRKSSRIAAHWKSKHVVDTTIHSISSSDDEAEPPMPQTQESVNNHGGIMRTVDSPKNAEKQPTSHTCHAGIMERQLETNYISKGLYESGGKHFVSLQTLKEMSKKMKL